MNLVELSAALEALWRMHGTSYAWDELARHLGEHVDADSTLWLLARRREARGRRVSYGLPENELEELWRFLRNELHQARKDNDRGAGGHPDDAKETGRRLAVLALATAEVSGWYRADQDRRYGGSPPRPSMLVPDPGLPKESAPSSFFGEAYERTKWRT